MSAEKLTVRTARVEDAERFLEIYAPYVKQTAITFEYDVPSVEEFRRRIAGVLQNFPYLSAELNGHTVGYAYAGKFHERAAYARCVETSIYVEQGCRRCGVGRKLYQSLEAILREMGILNLNACIGYPHGGQYDETLDSNSAEFHIHMGYSWVGQFHNCGFKFGRWYDMVWMEKFIGSHDTELPPLRTFNEVKELVGKKYGIV
jgi:L-amino acid N-acyltransferase YncA